MERFLVMTIQMRILNYDAKRNLQHKMTKKENLKNKTNPANRETLPTTTKMQYILLRI